MNDIEDIKVLEKLIASTTAEDDDELRLTDVELAALSHAIAALKAKSEAEVVCEWVGAAIQFKPRRISYSRTLKLWAAVTSGSPVAEDLIEAPALADLANRLRSLDKPIRIGTINP